MPQFLDFSTGKPVLHPSDRPGIRTNVAKGYAAEKLVSGELAWLNAREGRESLVRTFMLPRPGLYQARASKNHDRVVFVVNEEGDIDILTRAEERKFIAEAAPASTRKLPDADDLGIKWKPWEIRVRDGEAYRTRSGVASDRFLDLWFADEAAWRAAGFWTSGKPFKRTGKIYVTQTGSADQELERVKESKALSADLDIPAPPGMAYHDYQLAGIKYLLGLLEGGKRAFLNADTVGLGKTIQTIGVINALGLKKVLIIGPSIVRQQWVRELRKWLVDADNLTIAAYMGKPSSQTKQELIDNLEGQGAVIEPKTSKAELARLYEGRYNPLQADILVINYAQMDKTAIYKQLKARKWDMLVIDEAQRIKKAENSRTKKILGDLRKKPISYRGGLDAQAKYTAILTASPIHKEIEDSWPMLRIIDPQLFKSKPGFLNKYSNVIREQKVFHKGLGKYINAKTYGGGKNLRQLYLNLRNCCMLRRRIQDVNTELPDEVHRVIRLDPYALGVDIEEDFLPDDFEEQLEEDAHGALKRLEKIKVRFDEYSRTRASHALAKADAAAEEITKIALELQADGDPAPKIVVFAHHKPVVEALKRGLAEFDPLVIVGDTPNKTREAIVREFGEPGGSQILIASLLAAGTGLDGLQKQSHTAVFVEMDWVPENLAQAVGRVGTARQADWARKAGHEPRPVDIYYIVIDRTMDANIANKIVSRQSVIYSALDDDFSVAPKAEIEISEEAMELPEAPAPSPEPSRVTKETLAKREESEYERKTAPKPRAKVRHERSLPVAPVPEIDVEALRRVVSEKVLDIAQDASPDQINRLINRVLNDKLGVVEVVAVEGDVVPPPPF